MRKTTSDPLVGTTVAHYDVEAKLGGGGMGVVYAARDTKLGRRVALKFLPPQWSHDEGAQQRFIREAQAASATDHPNICTIHDIGTAADGQLFIVMALYDGQTLKTRLEGGRLSVDEALDVAAQVAEGLAKAHSQGVIHRDIKPGNLMLTEDGVKILDFGLAKFADARLKLTLEGSTIGTVAYMSPEQTRGEEADARSDVWAVGVVLYEMLTGVVPFKGGYPEAISHAIKNDPPAPIRTTVPEVSAALEQLVFRALHKDPAVRLQSARDLARALRLLQGRSLPLELRTDTLPHMSPMPAATVPRPSRWPPRRVAAAVAAVSAVIVGTPLWILSPVERIPIAVAPVVNQTGYPELDPYRLALTRELIAQLTESRLVRVLPHDRLLQVVRGVRQRGGDVSSREALQALTTHSGARAIVIPTLLYEGGAWRARIELRDAITATNTAAYDIDGVVSSLMKDAVYGLIPSVAARIDDHFTESAPWRVALAGGVLRMAGRLPATGPRTTTLDAAAEFEQGLDAYHQQEYAKALERFTAAAVRDERNPMILAWRARTARLARQDSDASEAAERAAGLLTEETPAADRLLVEAIVAEARRDTSTAQARYEELADMFSDEPGWLLDLAAFRDRSAANADGTARAITTYLQALNLDNGLTRADIELCRLYGPSRQNERVEARNRGQRALDLSRTIGDRVSEAQALICLTEVLRFGNDEDRQQAQRNAEIARDILADVGATYNLPRAELNVGLGAAAQGNMQGAATFFARALDSARKGGNRILEPLLLMNLGGANNLLGNRAEATRYYQTSSQLYEALGDEQRAAQQQANSAALRIEYGDEPQIALRDMQNALAVFQKLGDRNFEAFCIQLIAVHYRQAGRHADAERELNRALAILRERNLEDGIEQVTVERARSFIETGDYSAATMLLGEVVAAKGSRLGTAAHMHLARLRARVGDTAGAQGELAQASEAADDNDLAPLYFLVTGQVAFDRDLFPAARAAFVRAAAPWMDNLPDAASVEARAWIGFLDAVDGRQGGQALIQASLEKAGQMNRLALVARCRLFLARLALRQKRPADALNIINQISPDDEARTIGPELRAQAHYWRSVALADTGNRDGAQADLMAARKFVDGLTTSLPEADRPAFTARADIKRIVG